MTKIDNIQRTILSTLGDEKKSLLDRFCAVGLPTRKDEDFLYTDVAEIIDIETVDTKSTVNVSSVEGVNVSVEKSILQPSDKANALEILNAAASTEITKIIVPDNLQLTDILEINININSPEKTLSAQQIAICVNRNSNLKLIIRLRGNGNAIALNRIDLQIAENSQVDAVMLHTTNSANKFFTAMNIDLSSAARLSFSTINIESRFARNDFHLQFNGEGAEANINGLYIDGQNCHVDNHTLVKHRVPHCMSDALYKGIVAANATAAFAGRIVVAPDAQKTAANQTNRTMLLSREAHAYAQPQLEIYADDVKCSHGATSGQLDESQLFYMQQRGIDIETAKRLLISAFAQEIIDKIPFASVRDELTETLTNQN